MFKWSHTIDEIQYNFGDNGILQLTGWNTVNGNRYYFNAGYQILGNNSKLVIDISANNSKKTDIDWDAVNASGQIYGVILRIGFGNYSEDSALKRNLEAVKRLKIPYGIYLFSYAENKEESIAEADFTISQIKKYELNPTLGIYYDIEDWNIGNYYPYLSSNNPNDYNNIKNLYDEIIGSYVERMNLNKYNVGVYADLNHTKNKLSQSMLKYVNWIAQYNDKCTYSGYYKMWQFSSTGKIPGITGNVDLSYYYTW